MKSVFAALLMFFPTQAVAKASAFIIPEGYIVEDSRLAELFLNPQHSGVSVRQRRMMRLMHRALTCRYSYMLLEFVVKEQIKTREEKLEIERKLGNDLTDDLRDIESDRAMLKSMEIGRTVWGEWFIEIAGKFAIYEKDAANTLINNGDYNEVDVIFRKNGFGRDMQHLCAPNEGNIPYTVSEWKERLEKPL